MRKKTASNRRGGAAGRTEGRRRSGAAVLATVLVSVFLVLLCIGIGSVPVSLTDMLSVFISRISGAALPASVSGQTESIFWNIRLPRVLTAFLAGGALSVSGAIIQAVLQNPLASSYTLGVSSGASLGAALVIAFDWTLPLFGNFTLPVMGFSLGLATVLSVLAIASAVDRSLHTQTVILIGMVVSLFVNAMMTLVSTFASSHAQQLLIWTMGSFNAKRWYHVKIMAPVCIAGTAAAAMFARPLDVMSFGDEQAYSIGVSVKRDKKLLLILAALMTGVSVCFTGTIGFIDLVTPHVVRKIFGASHKLVIPMSFVLGGAFMAVCDMISRTILSPREIPVGAVTALVGAPFFVALYLRGRRNT
ncbi:MAG: FecCD family ABC transporter permease [Lachnospiraceae bacterium]